MPSIKLSHFIFSYKIASQVGLADQKMDEYISLGGMYVYISPIVIVRIAFLVLFP